MNKTPLRMLILLLCLALGLSASCCAFAEAEAPDAETFEALMADYTNEAILARHDRWQRVVYAYHLEEEPFFWWFDYNEAETGLYICSAGFANLLKPDLRVDWYYDGDKGYYYQILFDSLELCEEMFHLSCDVPIVSLPEEEVLVETVDAGDGLFLATTEVTDPELVKKTMENYASKGGYAYEEGMGLRYVYTFDKQSSDLLSVSVSLIDAQGESHSFEETEYAYDDEPYPYAEEDGLYADYFAALGDPEQACTVSLTFAVDTADEHTIEWMLPVGIKFDVYAGDAYVQEMYTDRECTQLYEGEKIAEDLELYVK